MPVTSIHKLGSSKTCHISTHSNRCIPSKAGDLVMKETCAPCRLKDKPLMSHTGFSDVPLHLYHQTPSIVGHNKAFLGQNVNHRLHRTQTKYLGNVQLTFHITYIPLQNIFVHDCALLSSGDAACEYTSVMLLFISHFT